MEKNYIEETIRLVGTHRMVEYQAENNVRFTGNQQEPQTRTQLIHPKTGAALTLTLDFLGDGKVHVLLTDKGNPNIPVNVIDQQAKENEVMLLLANHFHPELKND